MPQGSNGTTSVLSTRAAQWLTNRQLCTQCLTTVNAQLTELGSSTEQVAVPHLVPPTCHRHVCIHKKVQFLNLRNNTGGDTPAVSEAQPPAPCLFQRTSCSKRSLQVAMWLTSPGVCTLSICIALRFWCGLGLVHAHLIRCLCRIAWFSSTHAVRDLAYSSCSSTEM